MAKMNRAAVGWFLGGAAAGVAIYAMLKKNAPQLPCPMPTGGPSQEPTKCPPPMFWHPTLGKCLNWCKDRNDVFDDNGNCVKNPCPPCHVWYPGGNACIKSPFC
jgi:hypothetical protein